MNINSDYNSEQELNAITAMETIMGHLAETLIIPAEERGDLDDGERRVLGIVGITLQTIAEKAHAFERLQNGEDNENSVN